MARLYRCYNPKCTTHPAGMPGYDFTADVPVCPKCGVDARQPRFANLIVTRTLIHFDPPSGVVPGYGKNVCVCDGKPLGGRVSSGDPDAVNCPACRESAEWQDAQKGKAVDPRFDFDIEVTPSGPKRVDSSSEEAPVGG